MVQSLVALAAEDQPPELLAVDLATAAEKIDCSVRTLRGYIDREELRAFQIGRSWRVRVSELNAFMKKREQLARNKRPEPLRPRGSRGKFTRENTPLLGKG